MRFEHLSLVNFRNFSRAELDFLPGLTVLLGGNAQGKSNLLEGLYMASTTRSFRATTERDLINWHALDSVPAFARLVAKVHRLPKDVTVEVLLRDDSVVAAGSVSPSRAVSKRVRLNGLPKRAMDVIGQVAVVMFTPQDIDLVTGSPSLRRRYLDLTICQIDAEYCRALARYNRVVVHRNHLLRRIREGHARADQLEFWNQEMTQAGACIVVRRREIVGRASGLAADVHRRIAGLGEDLDIAYRASLVADDARPGLRSLDRVLEGVTGEEAQVSVLNRLYSKRLAEMQAREIAQGMSLLGPHRDDLLFSLNGRSSAAFCSRGQQRTIALALKLAEVGLISERVGDAPVVLLDDVMSELDEDRRAQLLGFVGEVEQVIVSATDQHPFAQDTLAQATMLQVKGGVLTPIGA